MTRIRHSDPSAVRPTDRRVNDNKTPALRKGDTGASVRKLEKKLHEHGLLPGKVDDFFDARTKKAVQKIERSIGREPNGVVGNGVWRALGVTDPTSAGGRSADTFETVNINVKSNPLMRQRKVAHDVKRAARQGGLIGWNEIGPDRYFKAIRDLGPEWGHYMPKHGKYRIPNPISWKKSEWELQDQGFMKTHGGMAKVSPSRYITWVKLKHRATDESVIRINTHLVSGAWSERKATTPWRRNQWHTHMDKLRDLVSRFEKQGHTVIVGGDFNRDGHKVLGGQVAYDNAMSVPTKGGSTLDYLMHVKNDAVRMLRSWVHRDYKSDHDAVVARYKLKDD